MKKILSVANCSPPEDDKRQQHENLDFVFIVFMM